jgi:uncharacterized protein YjeT (DUF2065 family)
MSSTLWIATAVIVVSLVALLAAPSVWRVRAAET